MVPSDTVVMALAGQGKTRGMVAITKIELCTNQSLAAIVTDRSVYSRCLLYYLETQYENLRAVSSGDGTRGGLNLQIINEYSVCLPEILEQKKIADFFEVLDSKIEKQKSLIAALKKYKRGVSNKIFADASLWDQVPFLDLFSAVSDKPYQITTSEYYDTGVFEVVDQGKNDIVGYNDDASKVYFAVPIIIYGDHTTIIKYRDKPFIVGGDGVKLLSTHTKNSIQYLYYALCQYNIKPEGYKRHFSIVKELNLPVPSLDQQQRIAKVLATIDLKIQKETMLLEVLLSQKKSLLQQLFI